MKIMFAADDKVIESTIAKRFGHAAYYLIYDTDNKDLDVRINNGHDNNHSALIDLMNEGITSFIIGNIGPKAFEVLKKGNAKIYLARKMTAQKALNKLFDRSLEELDAPTLKRSIEPHENNGRHTRRQQHEQRSNSHHGRNEHNDHN